MDNDYEKQKKRIADVFPENINDISRRGKTIEIYKNYLMEKLTFPVKLTGIDDFEWEEFYVLGPGDEDEYEELKKTRPSYKDIFSMSKIDDYYDEDYGLLAKVTRIRDKKRFQIPLADLETVDKKTKEFQLLDDYSVWFVNY